MCWDSCLKDKLKRERRNGIRAQFDVKDGPSLTPFSKMLCSVPRFEMVWSGAEVSRGEEVLGRPSIRERARRDGAVNCGARVAMSPPAGHSRDGVHPQ